MNRTPENASSAAERATARAPGRAGRKLPEASGIAGTRPDIIAAMKLNLGCGDKILEGYVNVDVVEARAGKRPDVQCDLRHLEPFENDSAEEILAVHVIEHFWRWEVASILKEWLRVLRPGGRMVLECPNLASACEALLADPDAASMPGPEGKLTMWVLYGDPRWQDPLMVHRWGYTPKSLARLMREVGMINTRQEPAQFKMREPRDMRIVGEKPAAPYRVKSDTVLARVLGRSRVC